MKNRKENIEVLAGLTDLYGTLSRRPLGGDQPDEASRAALELVEIMKVTVTVNDTAHAAEVPYQGAEFVFVHIACPKCQASAPIKVHGRERRIESHDTYAAEAYHAERECAEKIGVMRATLGTIFGLEEDEAVLLHGRARVY